jgi:hypothetical protein
MIKNFSDIPLSEKLDNQLFKNSLIKTMLAGISDQSLRSKFEVEINYIIDNKREIFKNDLIIGTFYENDDKIEDLILPSVKRAWSMIFINPPTLFTLNGRHNRIELLKLLWDIDEFIDYVLYILPKVKNCLDNFENLDRSSQTLELIVQNYINGLIDNCRNKSEDQIKIEIRDLKIKKTLK